MMRRRTKLDVGILQRALHRLVTERRRCRKLSGTAPAISSCRRYQDVVREGKHLAMGEDTDTWCWASPPRVSR